MKKAIGVVHSLWTCDDCGKSFRPWPLNTPNIMVIKFREK